AYVRDDVTSVSWAEKELKAFRQVRLEPGETAFVRIEIPVAECTIVDAAGRRVVEPGTFDLLVGPSSRDDALRAARFTVARASVTDPSRSGTRRERLVDRTDPRELTDSAGRS
ncbi:MAG: fibronectin type III-like domain-contianing protein, partial [Candidatus Microbacterium stercoravium]